jgi:hypothetical protein
LVFINVTYNPNFEWVAQQFRNAFDTGDYPTLSICDNDMDFVPAFKKMLEDYFDMKLKRTPYRSPQKNGRVERFNLSLVSEAFVDVVPISSNHAIRICREYQDYYNEHRPHQGINGDIPNYLGNINPNSKLDFEEIEHMGGKIVSFRPKLVA